MCFTFMGTGCQIVTRLHSQDTYVVVGLWDDGRMATYRGLRKGKTCYGGVVYGTKGIVPIGKYAGYGPLVDEIVLFFKTGKPPVPAEETIEIFAFMTAADESKRQNGQPVALKTVIEQAEQRNSQRRQSKK